MIRKVFTVAMLGVIFAPAMFTIGCASENQGDKPYSLTGTNSTTYVNAPTSYQERVSSSDDGGRYHSEPGGQGGH
jgi:hypothetical protein